MSEAGASGSSAQHGSSAAAAAAAAQAAAASSGPPYAPQTAQLGGLPTVGLDVPICAVMLFLYLVAAATHMFIFQVNRRRDHKFLFSALFFGFCVARIITLALRIGWATVPHNVNVAIAASIFTQAGVLLLFVVNLVFSQRVVRSYHPTFGWSKGLAAAFKFLFFCVGAMLIMVITAAVYSFFTLSVAIHAKLRIITLFAGTFLALLAFLPIPITILSVMTPRRRRRPEKFGQGRYRTKISLLLFSALLLSCGACFRLAVNFSPQRALTNPAWYHSKACFYCFNFVIEIIVVYTYAITRFDRRFHVPDGSKAPGHYSGVGVNVYWNSGSMGSQRSSLQSGYRTPPRSMSQIEVNREADVYGDDEDPEQRLRETEWEARAVEELNKAAALESV